MTSANISLGEKIKNKHKYLNRTLWTYMIAVPLMAVYYVFGMIMVITKTINYAETSGQSMEKFYNSRLDAVVLIMGFKQFGWLIAMFCAIMFAYQGFSYLFSQSKLDFYLSQPTTRYQRIRKNFRDAIGVFTVLYVSFEILGLIIALFYGAVNGPVLLNVFVETLRTLITFIVVYLVTVLAMFLSGNMPTAVLLTGFFAFLPGVISLELIQLKRIFFATFADEGTSNVFLSPLADRIFSTGASRHYLEGLNYNQDYNAVFEFMFNNRFRDLDTIVTGIIAFVLIIIVSKARKVEDAGKSIIYRPFRWFVKISICVVGGLAAAACISAFSKYDTRIYVIMCAFMVITAVIIGCIVEVLFDNNNIRSFNKGFAQTLMAVAIIFLIFLIHKGDMCGYDSYVPNASSVESCAFVNEYTSYQLYEKSVDVYNDYQENYMYITDVDDFIEMTKIGMAAEKEYMKEVKENGEYTNRGWQKTVLFRLKSGAKIYRQILIPYDIDSELMNRIVSSEGYKQGTFGCFNDDSLRKLDESNSSRMVQYVSFNRTAATGNLPYAELSDAYRKDVSEKYTYDLSHNELPIGCIEYSLNGREFGQAVLNVYKDYTNTIEVLKKYDIYLPDEFDLSNVNRITVTNYYPGIDTETLPEDGLNNMISEKHEEITYTDEQKIKEILDATVVTDYDMDWYNRLSNVNFQYTVEINGGQSNRYYGSSFCRFKKGAVPDFVSKDTNQ